MSVRKEMKLKVRKFQGLVFTFVEITEENLEGVKRSWGHLAPILKRVKTTCHANPGSERNFEESSLYILTHIFLRFSNASANNNVLL